MTNPDTRPTDGTLKACPDEIDAVARAIYLGLYEKQGGKWEAVETKDVWHAIARAALSVSSRPVNITEYACQICEGKGFTTTRSVRVPQENCRHPILWRQWNQGTGLRDKPGYTCQECGKGVDDPDTRPVAQAPADYVLVPREPTLDMIIAGCVALASKRQEIMDATLVCDGNHLARTKMRLRYAAMLAAAPSREVGDV